MWSVFSKGRFIHMSGVANPSNGFNRSDSAHQRSGEDKQPWESSRIFPLTTKVPIDLIGPHPPRRHLAIQLSVRLHPHSAWCNMHPVLLIDELLREVFDLCCLDNEYRKTLVQLARCCQAWEEPALQKAWENLPCITPLTKLVVSAIRSRTSSCVPLTSV